MKPRPSCPLTEPTWLTHCWKTSNYPVPFTFGTQTRMQPAETFSKTQSCSRLTTYQSCSLVTPCLSRQGTEGIFNDFWLKNPLPWLIKKRYCFKKTTQLLSPWQHLQVLITRLLHSTQKMFYYRKDKPTLGTPWILLTKAEWKRKDLDSRHRDTCYRFADKDRDRSSATDTD